MAKTTRTEAISPIPPFPAHREDDELERIDDMDDLSFTASKCLTYALWSRPLWVRQLISNGA